MDARSPFLAVLPLLDIQPDAQLIVDRDGFVLAANAAASRLLGTQPEGMIGSSLSAWLPGVPDTLTPLLRQSLRSTQPVPARVTLRRADGQPVDALAHLGALHGALPGDRVVSWIRLSPHAEAVNRFVELNRRIDELSREIADRRRAEAALAQQRQWLSVIIRSIADSVVVTDTAGKVVFLNPTAERMSGWAEADAIGEPIERVFVVVDPVTRQPLSNPVRQALKTRCECSIVDGSLLLTPSGKEWPIDDTAAPIIDSEGELQGAVLVFRDISSRAKAERERAALEDRLRETQKLEAIGTLAGGIAHDFNNVVGSILANAGMAIDGLPADHGVQPALRNIRIAGGRARDLVRKILSFSRRHPHVTRRLALQSIVHESVELLQGTLPARVQLLLSMDESPCPVRADPTQLMQLMLNLCTNAWQAMDRGAGQIEIRVARRDVEQATGLVPGFESWQPGECAVLTVRDNGCGMDAATQRRIFEPFFTTKQEDAGTGLGLSVVHGIVSGHGGAIALESHRGSGTTFTIFLPLAEAETELGELDEAPTPSISMQGLTVVYVDDDEVMRVTMEALLSRAGARVLTFGHGDAALAAFADPGWTCDVLVTDYNMPRVSGLDLARSLRVSRPALAIIITTGYLSDELLTGAAELNVRLMKKEESYERIAATIQFALQH